jgi:hypothetical protein
MSLIFATQLTAVATTVLAAFAIVGAWYARRAFLKQSEEVRAIERQVTDQETLTGQQAKLLEVQSGQLDLQRQQLDEQREVNAKQTEVLELQATELRESLAERRREASESHRAQASRVFITQERRRTAPRGYPEPEGVEPFVDATVVNTSDQPIYDAELRWHIGTADHPGEPNPQPIGTVMPGKDEAVIRSRPFPYGVDMTNSGVVVRFTDANRVRWLRRPGGDLHRLPGPDAE